MAGQRYYIRRGDKTIGPLTGQQVGAGVRRKKFRASDTVANLQDGTFFKLGEVHDQVVAGAWLRPDSRGRGNGGREHSATQSTSDENKPAAKRQSAVADTEASDRFASASLWFGAFALLAFFWSLGISHTIAVVDSLTSVVEGIAGEEQSETNAANRFYVRVYSLVFDSDRPFLSFLLCLPSAAAVFVAWVVGMAGALRVLESLGTAGPIVCRLISKALMLVMIFGSVVGGPMSLITLGNAAYEGVVAADDVEAKDFVSPRNDWIVNSIIVGGFVVFVVMAGCVVSGVAREITFPIAVIGLLFLILRSL